jgi:cytochrome c-type biogenesis protein CcmF
MVSYAMGYVGLGALWLCFAAAIATVVCLVASRAVRVPASAPKKLRAAQAGRGESLANVGYLLVFVAALAIFVSCAVIVEGFFTHNIAIQYVAQNYPSDTGSLHWLYLLAGLWASRAGSLLTWGLLIALFAAWVAWHRRNETDELTTVALAVIMVVLVLFCAVMLFSSDNSPFIMTSSSYIGEDGQLTGTATAWGMNVLLEHWAMALHPPTLFVGYAGMTVPFAYAIAALVCNDPSKRWVDLCGRIALFSFIFLSIGIGLGAVWAYVVLGWGGYWGWDPVENASLLSWLTSVAMLHSFTVYRKKGMMKGWAVLTATLTFVCVILGTFITRSGLVESVHAFSADVVSTVLFLVIMLAALVALAVLWAMRRCSFTVDDGLESFASKNASYFLTNVVMVAAAVLLAYLTVASALPTWLPLGGMSVGSGAYETIARPAGILFCLLAAVCPFLSWKRTDGAEFRKNVRVPALVALVLFVLMAGHWAMRLLPAYQANLAQDDVLAVADLTAMGPSWYYNGLALLGFAAASLLIANSAYLIVRGVRGRMANRGEKAPAALAHLFAKSPAQAGGYLTHLGLGIILVGLVGSAMFVTERTVAYSQAGEEVSLGSYTVTYLSDSSERDADGNITYTANLVVARGDEELGEYASSIELTAASYYGQARYSAVTVGSPFEDLFIVFQGYNDGVPVVNVRVNPLISFVWLGFAVLVLGIVCAAVPKRGTAALKAAAGAEAASVGCANVKAN